jgi:hypothetical protein
LFQSSHAGEVPEARHHAIRVSRHEHAVDHFVCSRQLAANEESPGLLRGIAEPKLAQRNGEFG